MLGQIEDGCAMISRWTAQGTFYNELFGVIRGPTFSLPNEYFPVSIE